MGDHETTMKTQPLNTATGKQPGIDIQLISIDHGLNTFSALVIFLLLTATTWVSAAEVPYVNWENHPVHAVDISPDNTRLAVAHTADNRVQLFDISQGLPVRLGHVKVGVDPVAVRFRDNDELWVVNHISDSISVVDFNSKKIKATLQTGDEPFDVVFAQSKAYVSCSQVNQVLVFDFNDLSLAPEVIDLLAEEPRALAVNANGTQVYVASFESGNKTTILSGGIDDDQAVLTFPPNAVNEVMSPYNGTNPPFNNGNQFTPAFNANLPTPPKVSLIVKQNEAGRWMDDNNADWTSYISGDLASLSGRVQGWELIDHDIAVIDTMTHEVSYVSGLMNIGMAIGFNQAKDQVTLVGTDATNEIRFEPNLNGVFLKVQIGMVSVEDLANPEVFDLNPHLTYQTSTEPQSIRNQSIGDPRGVVWNQSGKLGYVTGMGSNNVVVINDSGERVANIPVGEGATGLALDETNQRLYVWNHFAASLSTIDLVSQTEINQTALFNPLPEAIKEGRKFLYDTHETSGLGQSACASCHVDGRMDRLAWDLGDPAGEMKEFNQNCQSFSPQLDGPGCTDFHPMKGPMMTQTFQDIIGHEPFHWRGDRDGLEEFNGAFLSINGDDESLNSDQMQQFKSMVSTITFPPNPFRNLDNSLPDRIDLKHHYTSGRFSAAGQPLGDGNPQHGLTLFNSGLLDGGFQCASCHTIPTGMAVNGPLLHGESADLVVGGEIMPLGPMNNNHLGIVSDDGSTQKSIKTPQLRNLYEKVGFEMSRNQSLSGFGFLHDGSIDSVARFISSGVFKVRSNEDVADLVALMMAFSGSDLDPGLVPLGNLAPESQDTHAGVGKQLTLQEATQTNEKVFEILAVADTAKVDLIAQLGSDRSFLYDPLSEVFHESDGRVISIMGLNAQPSTENPLTFSLVAKGLGERLAFDRDGDGIYDNLEISNGSDPSDATSTLVKPLAGMWFNPKRDGHGMELQFSGENMFIIWFTYNDDGSPTWYIASGQYSQNWQTVLSQVTWDATTRTASTQQVGTVNMNFESGKEASFSWDINGRTGSEKFQHYIFSGQPTIKQHTSSYYNTNDVGWGVSVFTQGSTLVSLIYYYDEGGAPKWAIGTGSNSNGSIDMFTVEGFCPDCDFVATTSVPVGTQDMTFLPDRKIGYSVNLQSPEDNLNWQLDNQILTPISNVFFDPELQ